MELIVEIEDILEVRVVQHLISKIEEEEAEEEKVFRSTCRYMGELEPRYAEKTKKRKKEDIQ